MFDKLLVLGAASAVALTGYVSGFFGDEESAVPTGQIYHYIRDSGEGMGEDVYVYRAAVNHVEIYTSAGRCRDAELMSAWIDPQTGRAALVTGGRLMPGARHENFLTLAFDGTQGRLRGEAMLADGMVEGDISIEETNWHLRDFELATLSVQTMGLADPRGGFSFALPTTVQDGVEGGYLDNLGMIEAEFVAAEPRDSVDALRFALTGTALTDSDSNLWLDAETGHVIAAEIDLRDDRSAADMALRLEETISGGEATWVELLRAHYDGCATA